MVKDFRGWAHPDMAIDQIESVNLTPSRDMGQDSEYFRRSGCSGRISLRCHEKTRISLLVVDLFHNPTTMALADIVLPAATLPRKGQLSDLVGAS